MSAIDGETFSTTVFKAKHIYKEIFIEITISFE